MLGFCSNAGPSFLFGILGSKFTGFGTVWLLWLIQILSAMLTGALLPNKSQKIAGLSQKERFDLPAAMGSSLRAMASVCGWVVLFRCVIAFLQRWILWILPVGCEVGVVGILELANGCLTIDRIANESLRFILCSAMLSFGGICVAMQTASVTGDLGMGSYFLGKLLQCAISVILGIFLQGFAFGLGYVILSAIGCIAVLLILRKMQNNSSNREPLGV